MSSPDDNEMARMWKGRSGRTWAELQSLLDGIFEPLVDLLVADIPDGANDSVLDIGCGAGATTRAAAARLGPQGRALGIDISDALIEVARAKAVGAADFRNADAETHPFTPASFDRLISRFGIMFFADPVRAFANLHVAAKPDAAMHLLTWRSPADNPFMTTAERAAESDLDLPKRAPNAPGQFGLADADYTRGILVKSGWREVAITPRNVPCAMRTRDLETYFTRVGPLGAMLEDVDPAKRAAIVAKVRAAFEPFVQDDLVRFECAIWQVRARA